MTDQRLPDHHASTARQLAAARPLREAYERVFRALLWRVRPRRLQLGIESLQRKAERHRLDCPLEQAWLATYQRARAQVIRQRVRGVAATRCSVTAGETSSPLTNPEKSRRLLEAVVPLEPPLAGPDFHCDAALGGLARWLRAAGYDAAWWPGIDDDELLGKTLASSAIMLTTDRRLAQRGVIVRGAIPALLVPISLTKHEQFAWTAAQLQLPRKPPRCMACGGRLRPVNKLDVRERIPPRTYPWRDEYFGCQRCDKLFWEGTHWQRIAEQLDRLAPPAHDGSKPPTPGAP